MKEYYVYILRCSDRTYYTGVTNNYRRRLQEHQSDLNPDSYTHRRRPLELVYLSAFRDIREAIRREKQIKRWTKNKKTALIQSHFLHLHELAACKNDSHFSSLQIMTHIFFVHNAIMNLAILP